jgi:hypothetical protein
MNPNTRKLMLASSVGAIILSAPIAFTPKSGFQANTAAACTPDEKHKCCQERDSRCGPSGGIQVIDHYEIPQTDTCPPTLPEG